MNPLIYVSIILFSFAAIFIIAYICIKDKKEAFGFDRNMKDKEIIKRLYGYIKPYYKILFLIFFIILFTNSADIILPLISGDIISILQTKGGFKYSLIVNDVIFYVTLLLLSLICVYIQAIILQKIGQKIVSKLREDLFTHIEGLSANQLNHIPVGKLVTRVANDTNAVSMMFTNIFVNLFKNAILVIGFVVAMFLVNVKLALLVMCFVPFIILFTLIFVKFSRRAYRKVKNTTTDMNTFLSENLSGMKITQIFNQENKKMKEFNQRNEALRKSKYGRIAVFSIFRPTVYMLYVLNLLLLFYLAGSDAINNVTFLNQVITCETIVIFYTYIGSFFNPIQTLAEQFDSLQSAFASSEKIFSILDMKNEIVDDENAIEIEHLQGEIEFKDVWFAYNENEWVLKGVSFKILPKQTVALVGSTGSGKSTILSLLVRNYDIQKGQILIDGIDIKKIKISSLRKHFGQMLQDVFIFSGTIRSNIVLRDENISDEQIIQACEYVNAMHFINKLDNKLDEVVRERGNNFSAGQRQLISFARTIVHKPEVMILDEATANIDTETEVLIQDSLNKMMNIGTMIIVAHRLSTIQHADNIIVLSHGNIIEQGNHQQLLKNKGKYYKLYQLQFHKEQIKNNI
ncbi:MAG: ABC transporter ATP-binding protein/permease [Erysipelotrichaceae bacterium]|nr:ABC transporter ATP-binding protein/permease [Erysipelotrichaceae bacterium]